MVEFIDADPGEPNQREIAEAYFAVVDVETSGLKSRRHRVLQVAVVTTRADGTVIDRWSSYVRPRSSVFFRLGPKHIHRIERWTLRSAPRLADVIEQVNDRVAGKVLTAHNLVFDEGFLTAAAARVGRQLPGGPRLCTLLLSRSLDPDRTYSHGLAGLCQRYDIPLTRHHDALADAEATAALLPHLLGESGLVSVEALAQFVGR